MWCERVGSFDICPYGYINIHDANHPVVGIIPTQQSTGHDIKIYTNAPRLLLLQTSLPSSSLVGKLEDGTTTGHAGRPMGPSTSRLFHNHRGWLAPETTA
jgi:hypothetical protein